VDHISRQRACRLRCWVTHMFDNSAYLQGSSLNPIPRLDNSFGGKFVLYVDGPVRLCAGVLPQDVCTLMTALG
jgi:hypothetical protein